MANETAQKFIEKLQGKGVILLVDEVFYFVRREDLEQFKMPDGFQKGALTIDRDYFFKSSMPAPGTGSEPVREEASAVFNGMKEIVGAEQAKALGKSAAIRTEASAAGATDKKNLRALDNDGSVLFGFKPSLDTWPKIYADMSKGGKPSKPL